MMLLSVNFHYVGREQYPHGGIYPVTPEAFKAQLQSLGEHFVFVSLRDVEQAVKGERELPQQSCLITFDDGLRCQYELALPVLEELEIPAGFFVNGLPLFENKFCDVHKIHLLRAKTEPTEFNARVDNTLERLYGQSISSLLKPEDSAKACAKYRYDSKGAAEIKYLLNCLLSQQQQEAIVGAMFTDSFPNEEKFCQEFYMDDAQVRELGGRGWLGIHTYHHKPLALLGPAELDREIGDYKRSLEHKLGLSIMAVSYPYGSHLDINTQVLEACERAGLLLGFTMERAFNRTLQEPLTIARVDTNDAPGGKSPLFECRTDGSTNILGNMAEKRTLYVKE